MVAADYTACTASLERYIQQMTESLEDVVRGFATNLSAKAILETPLGDSVKHKALYENRATKSYWPSYGLQAVEGFAQGSWQATIGQTATSWSSTYDGQLALNYVVSELRPYRIGQDIYITNIGPYIGMLENKYSDQAPDGIKKPTLAALADIYSISLKSYYREVTN